MDIFAGKPDPESPALLALWFDDLRLQSRGETVQFTFVLLGSFIFVSREFGERLSL